MLTLNDIQAALRRIRSSIYLSPCALSATFSESTGNEVYLKLDNLQRTGAFKERGALNKLLSLSTEERAQGVIAAENADRAYLYLANAQIQNKPLELVESDYAQLWRDRAFPGEWVQKEDGTWTQK